MAEAVPLQQANQRHPLLQRCEAILRSRRYKELAHADPTFEPTCMERRAVTQIAKGGGDLRTCLSKIPEIFQEIAKVATIVKDGQAVVKKREMTCRNDKCGNRNPNRFDYRKGGMIACMECGECIEELMVEEGAQFRDFTGEESRNHHGDAPNPYMSANYNSGTSFRGYRGARTSAGRERDYSMGSSQGGTTIEYKDDQKLEAMRMYKVFIKNNDVHQLIMDKAMTLFAAYRDASERVFNRPAILAACMLAAMIEAQVEEGMTTFECRSCGEVLGTRRDLENHTCPGMAVKKPRPKVKAAVKVDVPAIHRMGLGEVEAYVHGLNKGALSYFAKALADGLFETMRGEKGEDDSDDDTGARMTAGQHLLLATLPQLKAWMGNESAAKSLHAHLGDVKQQRLKREAVKLDEQMARPRIVKRPRSAEEDLRLVREQAHQEAAMLQQQQQQQQVKVEVAYQQQPPQQQQYAPVAHPPPQMHMQVNMQQQMHMQQMHMQQMHMQGHSSNPPAQYAYPNVQQNVNMGLGGGLS